MGFPAKSKSNGEGWGTGFLLVFFPENQPIDIDKKKTTNLFSPSSSSSSSSPPPRRTTSSHLLCKAQSTISICALLFFFTLLLFTLSTFEPSTTSHLNSRRHLSSNPPILYKPERSWSINILSLSYRSKREIAPSPQHALQGMGTLHRRGTKAMTDVVVGHVTESVKEPELRLFLRLLLRSGLISRSDVVLIFPSYSHYSAFETIIREENDSFSKLIREANSNGRTTNSTKSFDTTQFVKSILKEKEWGEPIWGRSIHNNYSETGEGESIRMSYGSVVSFVVDELDPENSLAGFLDHVPMSLRRWACYPMLLGRVRRKFRHVMLVDVKEVLLLGDPLSRVRTRSPETVILSAVEAAAPGGKHGKKHMAKAQAHTDKTVTPAVIMGGAREVRRLSNVMLTEIVRSATATQKKKNPVAESTLFNQLAGNEFVLQNINVVTSAESFPDASSLTRLNPKSSPSKHSLVRRGNSNMDIVSSIMKMICSLEVDSSVYRDC